MRVANDMYHFIEITIQRSQASFSLKKLSQAPFSLANPDALRRSPETKNVRARFFFLRRLLAHRLDTF